MYAPKKGDGCIASSVDKFSGVSSRNTNKQPRVDENRDKSCCPTTHPCESPWEEVGAAHGCVWLRQPPARAWVRSPSQLYLCSIDVRSNQSMLKMGAVASGERNVTLYEEKRSSSASAGPRHPACHRLTQACQHFEDVCAHLSRLPCPWPSSDIAMRMLSTTMKHVW